MNLIGNLLIILGWGLAIWSTGVGLSFSGILLMGFVGTGGREAGGQLFVMLLLTAAGFTIGYLVAKCGKLLVHNKKESAGHDESNHI